MDYVVAFVKEFVTLFSEMAPYLLLGFLLAGIIHVWIPSHLYVPKISKPTFKSVLWAALFGVPLPICSCGVIPTAIAIRREGASKGASVGFLISTPATGVDSILATYSLLGLPFAILRPVAAFATALFGGVLTNFATRGEETLDSEVNRNASKKAQEKVVVKRTFWGNIAETARYGFVEMVGNVSKWLAIGLLLGALISAFVPNDFFMVLRERPILCMFCVLLLAMPMYTCAMGSIPLALALVAKGITPGAALVLLMAGPATSIASMLVVGKAFGKRTLVAYLFSIAFGAMFFGFIVDTFFMDTFISAMIPEGATHVMGHSPLGVFDYTCAVLLGSMMIYSRFIHKEERCECGCHDNHGTSGEESCCCGGHGKSGEHGECCCGNRDEKAGVESCGVQESASAPEPVSESVSKPAPEPVTKTYKVFGMSCSHCKACVEKAAFALDGVVFASANVAKKELFIEGSVDEAALKAAIEDAGFEFGGEAK